MYTLSPGNIAILCVAFILIMVGLIGLIFPVSGKILKAGSLFGLSGFFVAKGASPLPCRNSDVLMSLSVLGLVIASKIPSPTIFPLALEISAILLTLIFAATGLTFKAIAVEQKRRRDMVRHQQ